jgi:hypothetical protein
MKPTMMSYVVEENNDKDKRFTVLLEKLGNGFKAECDCPEYRYYGRWCSHVDKAITCCELGFE